MQHATYFLPYPTQLQPAGQVVLDLRGAEDNRSHRFPQSALRSTTRPDPPRQVTVTPPTPQTNPAVLAAPNFYPFGAPNIPPTLSHVPHLHPVTQPPLMGPQCHTPPLVMTPPGSRHQNQARPIATDPRPCKLTSRSATLVPHHASRSHPTIREITSTTDDVEMESADESDAESESDVGEPDHVDQCLLNDAPYLVCRKSGERIFNWLPAPKMRLGDRSRARAAKLGKHPALDDITDEWLLADGDRFEYDMKNASILYKALAQVMDVKLLGQKIDKWVPCWMTLTGSNGHSFTCDNLPQNGFPPSVWLVHLASHFAKDTKGMGVFYACPGCFQYFEQTSQLVAHVSFKCDQVSPADRARASRNCVEFRVIIHSPRANWPPKSRKN